MSRATPARAGRALTRGVALVREADTHFVTPNLEPAAPMKPVPKLLQLSLMGAALFGAVAASQAATVRVVFDSNIFEGALNPDNVTITYPGLAVGAPRETAGTAAGLSLIHI